MKKLILFIFILFAASFNYGQDAPSDYTTNYRFRLWADGDNPGADSLNQNWIDLDLRIYYSDTSAFKKSLNNILSGSNEFTGILKLPQSLYEDSSNSIGFQGGLFAYVQNDSIKFVADRAWTINLLADAGVSFDTNAYALKDGDNSFTGNNTAVTFLMTNLTVGLTSNSGKLKIPYYTSTNKPTETNGSFYYSSANKRLKVYDGGWVTYLDSSAVIAFVQAGGVFVPVSGSVSLSTAMNFTSNGISFTTNTANYFKLPTYTAPGVAAASKIWTSAGEVDIDGSGEQIVGIKLQYENQDYDVITTIIPDTAKIMRLVNYRLAKSIIFPDGIKFYYGTDSDLEVYHSGTHGYIYNKTGDLYIRSFSVSDQIIFGTNSTDRWLITQDGDFISNSLAGAYDIGNLTHPVGNLYSNVIYLSGTSLATTLNQKATYAAVSDSLLNRKLDPLVFAISYPQAGEYIGPFRMSKDVEITSSYYYLEGSGSTVTFQVFYANTCDPSYYTGQSVTGMTVLYDGNITKSPSSGAIISDDIYDQYIDEGKSVWCKIVSITGSPEKFSLTLNKKGR